MEANKAASAWQSLAAHREVPYKRLTVEEFKGPRALVLSVLRPQVSASLKTVADVRQVAAYAAFDSSGSAAEADTCRRPQTRLSSEQAAVLVSGIAGLWTLQEDQTHALLLLSAMHPAQTPGEDNFIPCRKTVVLAHILPANKLPLPIITCARKIW